MKMKKIKLNLIILLSVCTLSSCTSDSISDLTEVDNSTDIVTYVQKIKPILDNQCVNCHGANNPAANLRLDTYENTRDAVLNRNVIERIALPQGNPLMMPQGGNRLPQNNINLFITWQNEGFQP
jgi:hypothetical protein